MTKHKHLSLDDRFFIKAQLDSGNSFNVIANKLGKDPSTISKEIKKRTSLSNLSCKKDSSGNPVVCPKLSKPPFVCNGCEKYSFRCGYQRRFYDPKFAQRQYSNTLSSSRQGVALNKPQFYTADAIISSSLKQGQHLYHISRTYDLQFSLSSIYRYFNAGYFSASSIDLPRKVKFKPRKKKSFENLPLIPTKFKIGRTYADFTEFVSSNKIPYWVEMDTVIGSVGGKSILTFDFTFCNFLFGLLLDDNSAVEVTNKIQKLKDVLKRNGFEFGKIFPIILTDNGKEFSNIFTIENDCNGKKETKLFFCNPYRSCEKPHVENTHTQLRNILPKGTTFDNLTQTDLNIIFSHINSVKKASLNGHSAFELFSYTYGRKLTDALGITEIDPENVIQNKTLLKQL